MSQVIVGKWGKSLAVRLPGNIVDEARPKEGERVEVETQDREIVIRRASPRFTLPELFAGKSPQEWREAYRGAFDWGPDVGREMIDE